MCLLIRAKLATSITLIIFVLVCFAPLPPLRATDRGNADRSDGAFGLGAPTPWLPQHRGIAETARNFYEIPECVVWEVVPSPNAGTINDQLLSVTAISPNDVWAAGWYFAGDGTLTLTEHWNGTSWSVVPSPHPDQFSHLYGITAVASNNVWAVGYSLQNGGSPVGRTLILHWNGTNWAVVSSPNPGAYDSRLFEVRAVNANDIWAVGYQSDCFGCPRRTLTEHWNGTSWSVVSSPNPGVDQSLTGIAAVNANEVWAAGTYRSCGQISCPTMTLTMRWNGTSWAVVPSPNASSGYNYITRMAAVPSSDRTGRVWAVGFYYLQGNTGPWRTLALYWGGSAWSIVPTPNSQTGGSGFSGVVAVSAQDVWAVGGMDSNGSVSQTMVQHWDGTSWTIVPSQSPGAGLNDLNYVAATSTDNLWAVGAYFDTAYNYRTLVERPDYTCGTK